MNTKITETETKPEPKIIGYRCSADGKHFAEFKEKRCKYCIPIYEGDKSDV